MGSALLLETGVVGVTGADAGEVEAWLLLVGLNLDHSGNVSRCTYRTTRSSRRWFLDLVVGWLVNMSKLSFGDWPVDETNGRVCFFFSFSSQEPYSISLNCFLFCMSPVFPHRMVSVFLFKPPQRNQEPNQLTESGAKVENETAAKHLYT